MKNKLQNAAIALLSLSAILLFVFTGVSGSGFVISSSPDDEAQRAEMQSGALMPVAAVLNDGECSLLGQPRLLVPYFETVRPILV